MKITLDLGKAPSIMVQVEPYAGLCAAPPVWGGARATLTVFPDPNSEGEEDDPHTTLDLESDDAEALLDVLQDAVDQLKSSIYVSKMEAHDQVKHAVMCPVCGTYADKRRPAEWGHADGRGHTCLGDGTVLIHAGPMVRVRVWTETDDDGNAVWVLTGFSLLTVGQVFTWSDSTRPLTEGEDTRMYTVLEAPHEHYDGYRSILSVRAPREP